MPFLKILLYGLPALPLAALTLPLYIIVPTFYTETLGLPLAAVGFSLLVVRVFDAVNDPVVGWMADRIRPRYGRRRTLFLASLLPTGIAAIMLFWPPVDAGPLYLAFWGCALSLGYTATFLPYSAWGAELAGGYAERSRIAGVREGITLVGTLLAIALPFAVGLAPADGLHGLALLGLAVAALLVLFGGVAAFAVPEPADHSRRRVDLVAGLRLMGRNKPFLRLIIAYFINGLANGIPATLFLYFVSDRLGAPDMRGPLLFLYFLCGIAGVPLALFAAGRLGKHRAWSIAMLAACGVFALVPVLDTGDVVPFAAICVATGILLGFDLALPPAIQADVIDVDTADSGEQRSGLYFAAWSLATKLALALGVGIVFPLLTLFGFEAAPEGGNSADAVLALAIVYAWVPVALKLVAIGLMWNFPLDRERQAELRIRIEADSRAA